MEVNASFGKTWDSVIDVFADRNISIATIDRASGLIVAQKSAAVPAREAPTYADCGTYAGTTARIANEVTWNVVVRGDSTRSTVRASGRFVVLAPNRASVVAECSSRGVWETEFEGLIKKAAEAKR